MYQLARTQKWERLLGWLKWYPIDQFREHDVEQNIFAQYCVVVAKQGGAIGQQGSQLLRENLPYSFEALSTEELKDLFTLRKEWME